MQLERSPQDGSAGHGLWPWWQLVKIPELCFRLKGHIYFHIGNNNWISHYDAVFQLNSIWILKRIYDGRFILEATFSFDWDLSGEHRLPITQVGGA